MCPPLPAPAAMPCRCPALGLAGTLSRAQRWTGALPSPARTTAAGPRSLPEQQGWVCPGFPYPRRGSRAQVSRLVSGRAGPWTAPRPGGRGAHLLDLLLLLPLDKSAQSEALASPATILRSPWSTPSWRETSRGAASGETPGGGAHSPKPC